MDHDGVVIMDPIKKQKVSGSSATYFKRSKIDERLGLFGNPCPELALKKATVKTHSMYNKGYTDSYEKYLETESKKVSVVHLHSPNRDDEAYSNQDTFIKALITSYENVIEQFLKTDKATLALCPIAEDLDPSITLKALAKALENKDSELNNKTIRLYNFDETILKKYYSV